MADLPPLNQLKAFEAVARHLSFTKAADELCVTPGALTRHIQALESYYETQLINRTKKQISLTEEARQLYLTANQAFELISNTSHQIKHKNTELRIKVFHSFAVRWLLGRLKDFDANYPDVTMSLTIGSKDVDLSNNEYDAAIIYSETPPEPYPYIELFPEQLYPVCSPTLLTNSKPFNMKELSEQTLILSTVKGTAWKKWATINSVKNLDFKSALKFEYDDAAIQAAIAGYGVALINHHYIEEEFKLGTLIKATEYEPVSFGSHYFIYSDTSAYRPEIETFRNWLENSTKRINNS